jgi:hypothetical protein
MIGAINNFVDEQKKVDGEATFTMVTFDQDRQVNTYDVVFDFINLQEVRTIVATDFVPRGMTPLLDSLGRHINDLGAKLDGMKEEDKPAKVVVVSITDGLENASIEFKRSKIMEMIKLQEEKYQWAFVYLGANQDAFAEGGSMGVDVNATLGFDATEEGLMDMGHTLSSSMVSYRKATVGSKYDINAGKS